PWRAPRESGALLIQGPPVSSGAGRPTRWPSAPGDHQRASATAVATITSPRVAPVRILMAASRGEIDRPPHRPVSRTAGDGLSRRCHFGAFRLSDPLGLPPAPLAGGGRRGARAGPTVSGGRAWSGPRRPRRRG